MQCDKCTIELAAYIRNATLPIGGITALIRRRIMELQLDGTKDERINHIVNLADHVVQGMQRIELEMLKLEKSGLPAFLERSMNTEETIK